MDVDGPVSPAGRRRAGSRSYSLHSDKSASNSHNLPPTPHEKAEKERRDSFLRGESKANPNAAILEAQPQTRAVVERVTLDSIRDVEARDSAGNLIKEPDLSNPTRPRWERPLDTIRSFEKAIDGGYQRRSHQRSVSDYGGPDNVANSRRTSYFNGPPNARYNNGGGYYNSRPDSSYDNAYGPPPPSRQRYNRGVSDAGARYHGYPAGQMPSPAFATNNGSYDGSDSTGPWNDSTDPSSHNSSFERLNGLVKPGEQGYDMERGPINEESDDYGFPQRPPPKGAYAAPAETTRQPIKLGGDNGIAEQYSHQGGQLPTMTRSAPDNEKRKSWLGRRLSRSK